MIYVFYNNDPLAEDQGGGAEHFRSIFKILEKSGTEFKLVASRLQDARSHPRIDYVSRGANFGMFFIGMLGWFWRNRRQFRDADVFHFHRNYAAWPKYLLTPRRGRVVISYHGVTGRVLASRLGPFAGPLRRLMLVLERRAVARADRVILVNAGDREELARVVEREVFARAEVVPAGFSASPFLALPPPPPPLAHRLLFLGRITRLKNPQLAVDVLEWLAAAGEPYSLTIAGDGEEAPALAARLDRSPFRERIRWLGRVPHARVPQLFAEHGILLLTSASEASPTVVKEALAAARPVVTTDVGDVRLWIEEGATGFVRSPEVPELAQAVRAASDLVRTGRVRRSQRVLAAREEVVVGRVVELYRELARVG